MFSAFAPPAMRSYSTPMPMPSYGAVGVMQAPTYAMPPPMAYSAPPMAYSAPSYAMQTSYAPSVPTYAPSSYTPPTVIGGGFGAPAYGGSVGGMAIGGAGGNVQALLADRKPLKEAVIKAFKACAGGQKQLNIGGLQQARIQIAQTIGVPESMFGSIQDGIDRFDFEGTGTLGVNELYKMIKWSLYDVAKQMGGKTNIPTKSIQQAGYTITSELGAGNQGAIKLATDRSGQQRAIKVFPKQSFQNMFSIEELQDEYETMQLLASKNIATTFEMFQDATSIYMVNEPYTGGDFRKLREKATAACGMLSDNWWKDVWSQCLTALVFMHQQAMMHCDVKEPNLMMRTPNYANPEVVLIDFGISKAMTAKDTGNVSGTPGYMPPETMTQGKWYPGGDVFSLGVAIYQIMTGKVPDDEAAKRGAPMIGLFLEGCNSMDDVLRAVTTRQPQVYSMQCSPQLQQLTARMLEKNMRSRPKAPTVLKDPWFSGFAPGTSTIQAMASPSMMAPAMAVPTMAPAMSTTMMAPTATPMFSAPAMTPMPAMRAPQPVIAAPMAMTPMPAMRAPQVMSAPMVTAMPSVSVAPMGFGGYSPGRII